MHKTWRLQGTSETCLIAPRSYAAQEEQAAYLSTQLDRWLANPETQCILIEMYESLHQGPGTLARRLPAMDLHRSVKKELLEAFRRGEFVMLRMPHLTIFPTITMPERAAAGTQVEEPPPKAQEPATAPDKTWLEIELVDQDGEPVPGSRFELELADGTKRTGTLDSSGRAQLKNLDPGSFKVSFPDFDASEWDTAQ